LDDQGEAAEIYEAIMLKLWSEEEKEKY
jgi:hypothetical protein